MPEIPLEYVEDAGPGIPELDPQQPQPAADVAGELEQPTYPGWSQDTIETFLRGTGAGIHQLIGHADQDWLMVQEDLDRIAPPLTRICNRWEPALRLSPVADPLLVAHGFALYGWRSALEARRAQRDAELEQPAGGGARYERADVDAGADVAGDESLADELADLNGHTPYFTPGQSQEAPDQ